MAITFLILFLILKPPLVVIGNTTQKYNETNIVKPPKNSSDVKKDMYVIHAVVYEVGIITNKTSNGTESNIGKQEAVTLFHSNGSKVNLSNISQPILTNITAQSLVGIVSSSSKELSQPLLANITNHWNPLQLEGQLLNQHGLHELQAGEMYHNTKRLYKRHKVKQNDTVIIVTGTALIPKEAGVHSIVLPPLLALNNNFTNIPVPIPNTSIVHYAKINTLKSNPEELQNKILI